MYGPLFITYGCGVKSIMIIIAPLREEIARGF